LLHNGQLKLAKTKFLVFWRLFSSPCMGMWGRWCSFEICSIGKNRSNAIDCNQNCSGDSSI